MATPFDPIDARQRLTLYVMDLEALRDRLDRFDLSTAAHRSDLRGMRSRIDELLADAGHALAKLRRRNVDREPEPPENPAPLLADLVAVDRRIGEWADAIEPGDRTGDAVRAGVAKIRDRWLSPALAVLARLHRFHGSEMLDMLMEELHHAERAGDRGAGDADRR